MKKTLRFLISSLLIGIVILFGILTVNTLGFGSKQVPIAPVEEVAVDPEARVRLQQAIRIPTISLPEGIDTQAFYALDTFLQRSFPNVREQLEFKTINDFGRVYHWPGAQSKLEPILLLAHMDVVPTADSAAWDHPPFSGIIKDDYVYGRGTLDDKGSVMAILEAVEQLLKEGYQPQRSLYLAFGQDEEISGKKGAVSIAAQFDREGISFAYILDEGGLVLESAMEGLKAPLAMIGIAEKGYVSLKMSVQLEEGGHSAMPSSETAIGLLSTYINRLETNPFPSKLDGAVGALLDHVGPEMTFPLKMVMANRWLTEPLIRNLMAADNTSAAMVRTTTAPTMISGGVKDNVLPTEASATINFRILPGETTESVRERVLSLVNDERVKVEILNPDFASDPSPVSDYGSFGFQVIQKTIQEIFPGAVVAPGLMIAATDARHYTAVSDNIFRFLPVMVTNEEIEGIHGSNERISIANYERSIRFYRQLILNSCD